MTGPQTVHLPPHAWRRRDSLFAGTHPRLILDPTIAGADLHGGVIDLDPGATVKLHYHRRGELQFVLAGRGKLLHADGTESPVAANSAVFSPANFKDMVFMGHGIGLENPDPPGMLTLTNDTVLQERMVINLEPILLDPEVGGARIETAFVVTSGDPTPLSECEIRPWLNR